MLKQIWPAIAMILVMTLITGIAYPLGMTGLAQLIFPHQANGSLIESHGKVIGSELIGQNFASAKYFHGRPSAAGNGYDASNSSGTNLGPTSKKLIDQVAGRGRQASRRKPQRAGSRRPRDLLGQRPRPGHHAGRRLFPGAAGRQGARPARRHGPQLVADHIEGRFLGVIGEAHVNVLKLNLALDALAGAKQAHAARPLGTG